MTLIKCLIVDDEPLAREGLASYAENVPFLQIIGLCNHAMEASKYMNEQQVDLLFLDINMPQLSGMDFLKSLPNPPMVVFTTAYREFAIESYELDTLDYLVKPISFKRFLKAANKAKDFYEMKLPTEDDAMNQSDQNYFFIKEDGRLLKISFDDILYVEGLKDYVFIHTKTARHIVLVSLKTAENQLPNTQFMRVHRSFIVALDKVEGMDGNQLIIQDKLLPVSRALKDEVFDKVIGNKLWKRE